MKQVAHCWRTNVRRHLSKIYPPERPHAQTLGTPAFNHKELTIMKCKQDGETVSVFRK